MRLFDRIAQCRVPFIAQDLTTGALTRLNGAADHAAEMAASPVRFVLADELTRLCTALVYSKGASQLAFADLLRIPAERVPHLRGSARCGVIRSRTVTWTLDQPATQAARSAQSLRI